MLHLDRWSRFITAVAALVVAVTAPLAMFWQGDETPPHQSEKPAIPSSVLPESGSTGESSQAYRSGSGADASISRFYEGETELPAGTAFDFEAPNGVSAIFKITVPSSGSWIYVEVNGEMVARRIRNGGGSFEVELGGQTCRFFVLKISYPDNVLIRRSCS